MAFETARTRAGLGADVPFYTLRYTLASWYMINDGDLNRSQMEGERAEPIREVSTIKDRRSGGTGIRRGLKRRPPNTHHLQR